MPGGFVQAPRDRATVSACARLIAATSATLGFCFFGSVLLKKSAEFALHAFHQRTPRRESRIQPDFTRACSGIGNWRWAAVADSRSWSTRSPAMTATPAAAGASSAGVGCRITGEHVRIWEQIAIVAEVHHTPGPGVCVEERPQRFAIVGLSFVGFESFLQSDLDAAERFLPNPGRMAGISPGQDG